MSNEKRVSADEVFSKRARFYTTNKVHDDKETLDRIIALASPKKDMVVLDVATGAGHTAMVLAPHVSSVKALDLTPEMLEEGRKLSEQRGITNITFVHGDVMSMPFDDGSFDIVACRRAAHHFTDIDGALLEMKRVLRQGGRLVIDDRTVPEDDEVDEAINRLDRLHDASHIRDHRPSAWENLLTRAGFSIISFDTYRKHMPLAHFTKMVEPETATKMRMVVEGMSERAKEAVNLEDVDGQPFMDNFFVLISAKKE